MCCPSASPTRPRFPTTPQQPSTTPSRRSPRTAPWIASRANGSKSTRPASAPTSHRRGSGSSRAATSSSSSSSRGASPHSPSFTAWRRTSASSAAGFGSPWRNFWNASCPTSRARLWTITPPTAWSRKPWTWSSTCATESSPASRLRATRTQRPSAVSGGGCRASRTSRVRARRRRSRPEARPRAGSRAAECHSMGRWCKRSWTTRRRGTGKPLRRRTRLCPKGGSCGMTVPAGDFTTSTPPRDRPSGTGPRGGSSTTPISSERPFGP
mmetsp:Transcript_70148/g.186904  ORF Transcript_70148/g.186904 Transcript_70148/m.186904 type:complete len:268 (-) Transcript_70148:171-974(-)